MLLAEYLWMRSIVPNESSIERSSNVATSSSISPFKAGWQTTEGSNVHLFAQSATTYRAWALGQEWEAPERTTTPSSDYTAVDLAEGILLPMPHLSNEGPSVRRWRWRWEGQARSPRETGSIDRRACSLPQEQTQALECLNPCLYLKVRECSVCSW
jgi:hypothetical protein